MLYFVAVVSVMQVYINDAAANVAGSWALLMLSESHAELRAYRHLQIEAGLQGIIDGGFVAAAKELARAALAQL